MALTAHRFFNSFHTIHVASSSFSSFFVLTPLLRTNCNEAAIQSFEHIQQWNKTPSFFFTPQDSPSYLRTESSCVNHPYRFLGLASARINYNDCTAGCIRYALLHLSLVTRKFSSISSSNLQFCVDFLLGHTCHP